MSLIYINVINKGYLLYILIIYFNNKRSRESKVFSTLTRPSQNKTLGVLQAQETEGSSDAN